MKLNFHGTFEAHITVKAENLAVQEEFQSLCQNLDIKCILIKLPSGVNPSQLMTSSYHHGNFENVLQKVNAIAQKITDAGFEVTRIKVEAMVSNQDVPISDMEAQKLPSSNYFEFHVKAILSGDENIEMNLQTLRWYCLQHNAHLSANAFKQELDGNQQRFITMRLYGVGYQAAQIRFDNLLLVLKDRGFKLSQQQREYTVYDSNLNLDTGWLNTDIEG